MKTNHFDIQEWAEDYSFDQLSEDKQKIVLNTISEEEYNDWHDMLMHARTFLKEEQNELNPDPSIFKSLENRVKKKTPLVAMWTGHIPLYKAAAACLLVGIGSYILLGKEEVKTVVVEKEIPVMEVIHDTITQEIETVKYVVDKQAQPKVEQAISTPYETPLNYSQIEVKEAPEMKEISSSFGNTFVNVDALEQFKVKI